MPAKNKIICAMHDMETGIMQFIMRRKTGPTRDANIVKGESLDK